MLRLSRCAICFEPLFIWQSHPCDHCLKRLTPAATAPLREPFQNFYARWLLTGTTYRALLEWKNRPTKKLKETLLGDDLFHRESHQTPWLKPRDQFIVPIPQEFRRSWKLGHSPTLQIAEHLSRNSGIQIVPLLRQAFDLNPKENSRQAMLNQKLRWSSPTKWIFNDSIVTNEKPPIILVDDVLTTGSTLLSAAHFLHRLGYTSISAWVLGARPSFNKDPVVSGPSLTS